MSFKKLLQILRAGPTIMSIKVLQKIYFYKILLQCEKAGNAVYVDIFFEDQSRYLLLKTVRYKLVKKKE